MTRSKRSGSSVSVRHKVMPASSKFIFQHSARPSSNIPPTILSEFRNRPTALNMKLFFPVMLHATLRGIPASHASTALRNEFGKRIAASKRPRIFFAMANSESSGAKGMTSSTSAIDFQKASSFAGMSLNERAARRQDHTFGVNESSDAAFDGAHRKKVPPMG